MKHKLNKTLIIEQAFEYADQNGLDKLSMRSLASQLDVKAMSLYNHIENKEDLIESIVDHLIGRLTYEDNTNWQTAIRLRSNALKDLLLKHKWGVLPLMYGFHNDHYIIKDYDRFIGILRKSGFSFIACDQIISSVNAYIWICFI